MSHTPEVKGMPEGAFDVLPAGKEYAPYIAAETVLSEVTFRSVVLGLIRPWCSRPPPPSWG
jgi:hypothetical protein